MLQEGCRAAWCYRNEARSLLPVKEKGKAEVHSRTGRSTSVAVLMSGNGSPGNVNPAGVIF